MNCSDFRSRLETGTDDFMMREHVQVCRACAGYHEAREFGRQTMLSLATDAIPEVPMSAIWAAIRRASASDWEGAMMRSFRRLVPYLAAVALFIVLLGPFISNVNSATTYTLTSGSTVTATGDTNQTPAELLGIAQR